MSYFVHRPEKPSGLSKYFLTKISVNKSCEMQALGIPSIFVWISVDPGNPSFLIGTNKPRSDLSTHATPEPPVKAYNDCIRDTTNFRRKSAGVKVPCNFVTSLMMRQWP